jgi:1,4-dihydroxy-2-naphthoate octaprenyltransferase
MPVFLLALSQSESVNVNSSITIFLILHFLIYPSSNGYNSYMDNDKGSIGGIKHPPKVPKLMFWISVLMDVAALMICLFVFDFRVSILLSAYILASRAYSYRAIRLKKYAILGFLVVTIFQGPVIYYLTKLVISPSEISNHLMLLSFISWLLIAAGYPLSQIYQHDQDRDDGVKSISMLLGVRGTFVFSQIMFALLGILLFYYFFIIKSDLISLIIIAVCLAPVLYQFTKWMKACFKDASAANYDNTMKTNTLGAYSINTLFIILTILTFIK